MKFFCVIDEIEQQLRQNVNFNKRFMELVIYWILFIYQCHNWSFNCQYFFLVKSHLCVLLNVLKTVRFFQ